MNHTQKAKNEFGNWLYNKLLDAGMTESELAKELGLTRVTISNHIRGSVIPHRYTLDLYADYFGIPWYVLYEMVLKDSK